MDWSNEQYVRLYIRDTKTWLKLRWEGQALFMMLLRKVDRAGVLDDIDEPVADLALITGLPEEHVEAGLERLLTPGGPVEINDKTLVIPNFIEANEAPKSDRLRAREYRERRKRDAMNTNRDEKSQEQTARHGASLLPVPNPKPVPNLNLERDLSRSNSKDEEEGEDVRGCMMCGFLRKDHRIGTGSCRKYQPCPDKEHRALKQTPPAASNRADTDTDPLPLQSPEANAVLAKIQEKWPDYPIDQAMVTASGIWTKFNSKLDVPKILEDAILSWPPGRSIHIGNGVHGYLTSFFLNREKDAQKAAETPSRGKGGVPHQAEATRPSLKTRVQRLEQAIKDGSQIENPHEMVDTWNEAEADQTPSHWRHKLRYFIGDLRDAGKIEMYGAKIVDHSLPADPRTPKELLEGDEAPDPEFVAQQIAKLTAMKGLKE
jgi:hypothetical protein